MAESETDKQSSSVVEEKDTTKTEETAEMAEAVPDEDLEDGEIEDDEEETQAEDAATETPTEDNVKTQSAKTASAQSPDGRDREKHRSHRERRSRDRSRDREYKHKKRRKDSKRSDLDAAEAKKRKLKEKLAALEMQMAADDEAMGVYVTGGSPIEGGVYTEDSEEGDSMSSLRSRSRSPSPRMDRRKRRRQGSREDLDRKRRREERHRYRDHGKEKSAEICKLFMQGKCPKSPENCMFSHDADPPKIMELCKFYLFERCAKKEKCLYLHKGFPCKYFHTGTRCLDTAESCKFSHEDLTDEIRAILLKHLEMAPKEILGDFPRMTREKATELVLRTEAKHKGWPQEKLEEVTQEILGTPVKSSKPADNSESNANTVPIGEKRRRSRWQEGYSEMPNPPGVLGAPMIPRMPPPMGNFGPDRPPEFNAPNNQMPAPGPGPGGASLLGPSPYMMPPGGPNHFLPGHNMPMQVQMPPTPFLRDGPAMPMNHQMPPTMPSMPFPAMQGLPGNTMNSTNHNNPAGNDGHSEDMQAVTNNTSPFNEKPTGLGDSGRQEEKPFKLSDHWYSSEEDESETVPKEEPKKIKNEEGGGEGVTLPKEITDVLQQIKNSGQANAKPARDPRISRDPRSLDQSKSSQPSTRDPRSRGQTTLSDPTNIPTEKEKDNRILEMDLGSVFGDLELPIVNSKESKSSEEIMAQDEMNLPFKPYLVSSVAKEIDASIHSHAPLDYKLRSIDLAKPDYADIIMLQHIPSSQVKQDPRLRRYALPEKAGFSSPSEQSAYSPTQQTFDLGGTRVAAPYNPNTDLVGKSNISASNDVSKMRRRDPRRRD